MSKQPGSDYSNNPLIFLLKGTPDFTGDVEALKPENIDKSKLESKFKSSFGMTHDELLFVM